VGNTAQPRKAADVAEREAERRQLTVLFADLVGSTALASVLDPEDWRNTVNGYQEASAAVIAKYDGHIAQFLGDGILAYFGFPKAHEDDAERGMLAGLGIVDALKDLAPVASGARLQVRIGVHTGPVVVGRMGRGGSTETLAIGHTMNVAARLQGLAEPNTVVVSETTRRLAAGQFVTRDLGVPSLKGIDEEIRAHRVLQASGVRSRLSMSQELTPFVGRERELQELMSRWARVHAGTGQVALVAGEPGVGKSRLILAMKDRMASATHTWLEARCSPYSSNSAFAPIRELLEFGLGFSKADSVEVKLAKLSQRIGNDHLQADLALPVLAAFLEIPAPEAPHGLSPEALREQTLHHLVEWGLAMSVDQPVLMLVEDMHWCDPSSVEFISRLVARTAGARMLVLVTSRPGFDATWLANDNAAALVLGGVTGEHARAMVEHLCAQTALSPEACERIVARADGVPLHVEELTKMLLGTRSSGTGKVLDDVAIPETLEGSLMARLDQLNDAKRVAQVAALLGREFEFKLLQEVAQLDLKALQTGLEQLVAGGLVFPRTVEEEQHYIFKHALIQDVSYNSMLKSRRREFHLRAATALQQLYPALATKQPELVARHAMEGESWHEASRLWLAAGLQAVRASANREAISYLQAGLTCVHKVEDPMLRAPLELELLLTLGPPLMATRGYADEDVERGYSRARELCRQLGEPPAVFPVMFGLWTYHCLRAKHVAGRELAAHMTTLAQASGEPGLLVEADLAMGANLFYLGQFQASSQSLARSIAGYDAQRDEAHRYMYGQDPLVGAHGYEPFALWLLGQGERALASSNRELELARRIDHPFSLTYALTFAAWFHRVRGDIERSNTLAQELRRLATERGVTLYRAVGVILCGSAQCERGDLGAGLALLEAGINEYRQTGSSVILPYWEGLLGEALRGAGRLGEAQAALERAFAAIQNHEERWCEPELMRYRARLLGSQGASASEVEQVYQQSIQIAQQQGAKAWELRSTLGLLEARPEQAAHPEWQARLRALHNTFVAEPATPDLLALQALFDRQH
jgi:class 3 adenylate cyclase/predicted ATPase